AIPATDLAVAGIASVTVTTAAPGGGTSAALSLPVSAAGPTLTALSPSSATAGGAGFTLTLTGTGFDIGASVGWNGAARTTTRVSPTQVTAAIPASDIAAVGTAQVTVTMPGVLGGTSGDQTFTITNPVPTLASLSPSSAGVGGAASTLTVNGSNFVSGSSVRWNGAARTWRQPGPRR